MGWFTGYFYRCEAEVPHRVKIYLDDGMGISKDFTEDQGYQESKLGLELIDWFTRTSYDYASDYARSVKSSGFRHLDTYYPVHRIRKVEVIPCEWVDVEREQKITFTERVVQEKKGEGKVFK